MRVLLYTGKGGVGKTSVAAATALRCAALGSRTLVVSTDSAHSLADAFDAPCGPAPSRLDDRLWATQIDIERETASHWGALEGWLRSVLSARGLDPVLAAELAALPGMGELVGLLALVDHAESGDFDVLVVDCAPTAETLRLLMFPDVARLWLDRAMPLDGWLARGVRPLLARLRGVPPPDDGVFDSLQDLLGRLTRARETLADADVTSVRLVLTPDRVVIAESQRLATALSLYGYPVDLVVCNRVLPDVVTDPYFAAWQRAQRAQIATLQERFAPVPVVTAPLLEAEPVGPAVLGRLGDALYGEADPRTVWFRGRALEVTAADDGFVLLVPLPHARRDDLKVAQSGDEVTVRAGSARRTIALPRVLHGLTCLGAQFDGDVLRLRFPMRAAD